MEVEEYTLKDLLNRIVDNRGKTCPTAETGTALIATNCIKNDQLYPVFENVRWVDQDTMETWFRGHPEPGDILFVLKGSPGRCCLVPDPISFCIAQDMLALRADESKVSQKFLFALLRSSIVRNAIGNLHVGTMIPHFKKGDFDQLTFRIPKSRKIQEWIGDQYFTLSNKIELNRRMNATLEAMAQALFKSWFVDFDPVIDNALAAGNPIPEALAERAEVRRQALANSTANREAAKAFPDSFQETEELGWIPEGWEVVRFNQILKKYIDNRGKTPPLSPSGIPMIEVKHISDNSITPNLNTGKYVDQETHRTWFRSHLGTDDIIISTVGTIGRICMVTEGLDLVIAQNLLGLRFEKTKASPFFMYYQMDGFRFKHEVDARLVITVQASIKRKDLETIDLLCPSVEIQEAFEATVKPLMLKQTSKQNESLTKLRDTLLPKLISGELRIPEAEQLTEEALT
jgi:type I restriction enzyme S subunit